jgi:hypothetical protein
MKTKNIFPLLIIALGAFFSCRPDPIDIGVAPAPVKLVLTSQVANNSFIFVGLTRSFSALNSGSHEDTLQNSFLDSVLVENAIVTVEHPGGTDTLYMLSPGIYASIAIVLQPNSYYTIHAKDPATNLEVSATTQLLQQITFDSIQPFLNVSGSDSIVNVHYELTDLSAGEDYYVFSYYRKSQDTGSFDLNNFFAQGTNELSGFDLITDQDFDQNGDLIRDREMLTVHPTDTIACTVSHITKGYYEFLTAYKRSNSLFNQLSGEPINYPTNVNGGYGYFATQIPNVQIFAVEDYW